MSILTVHHKTIYRYAKPVEFGEHRLMFRPRDSHDLRLIDTALLIQPAASVRWLHDVFGNSIAIASFEAPASELVFESSFRAEQFAIPEHAVVLEPHAQRYPFNYPSMELTDLAPTVQRGYPDPWGKVDTWARWFVEPGRNLDTLDILIGITRSIQYQFRYARRDEMGTQTAIETLESGSGNCRDFALFMMEAVRSLGFAAQFVSGYLSDMQPGNATGNTVVGGGATHAWVRIYLPGAGWVEFDPTNGLIGGKNLIRVAVVRDPSQALPLSGTFNGMASDFLGMSVDVTVTTE
jgi:transglutaminase-like putative cysteine protease